MQKTLRYGQRVLLIYCWNVAGAFESKGYDQGFKEAIVGMYGSLPEISISYPNKAIRIGKVNFGNVFHYG
jgi:hypothetical protein